MNPPDLHPAAAREGALEALEEVRARLPASGRLVVLRVGGDRDEIEVRSPDGAVEVEISFGAAGGARLTTGGDLEIAGRGEMRVKTDGDIRMNGAVIRLNCTAEEGGIGGGAPPAGAAPG